MFLLPRQAHMAYCTLSCRLGKALPHPANEIPVFQEAKVEQVKLPLPPIPQLARIAKPAKQKKPRGVFWARVQEADGCWLWTGAKHIRGYEGCAVWYGDTRAHRVPHRQ
jgi:hypothetical protein